MFIWAAALSMDHWIGSVFCSFSSWMVPTSESHQPEAQAQKGLHIEILNRKGLKHEPT